MIDNHCNNFSGKREGATPMVSFECCMWVERDSFCCSGHNIASYAANLQTENVSPSIPCVDVAAWKLLCSGQAAHHQTSLHHN